MKRSFYVALTAVAAMTVPGCGGKSDDVVAVVNGERITTSQFYDYLERKPTVRVQTENGPIELPVADTIAFQAIQDLIARQLILQMARDEGVFPTEADVEAELKFRRELDPQFAERLRQANISFGQIKEQVLLELARERLVTRTVTVTDQEVEDYIRDNPEEFREPATVDASWILVNTPERRAEVDQQLQTGQTFSAVAIRYSAAPNAAQLNGRFPIRAIAAIPEPIRSKVEATPEGRQTDWIRLADGWAKLFIERKTAARPAVMNPMRKQALKRRLALQRGQNAIDLNRRVLDRLLESEIDIRAKSLQDPWRRAFERFKEERGIDTPDTTGVSGAAPPAPEAPTK